MTSLTSILVVYCKKGYKKCFLILRSVQRISSPAIGYFISLNKLFQQSHQRVFCHLYVALSDWPELDDNKWIINPKKKSFGTLEKTCQLDLKTQGAECGYSVLWVLSVETKRALDSARMRSSIPSWIKCAFLAIACLLVPVRSRSSFQYQQISKRQNLIPLRLGVMLPLPSLNVH